MRPYFLYKPTSEIATGDVRRRFVVGAGIVIVDDLASECRVSASDSFLASSSCPIIFATYLLGCFILRKAENDVWIYSDGKIVHFNYLLCRTSVLTGISEEYGCIIKEKTMKLYVLDEVMTYTGGCFRIVLLFIKKESNFLYHKRAKGSGNREALALERTFAPTSNAGQRNGSLYVSQDVSIKNAAQADEIFSMLMGDDVEPRREFIEKNATYANIDA